MLWAGTRENIGDGAFRPFPSAVPWNSHDDHRKLRAPSSAASAFEERTPAFIASAALICSLLTAAELVMSL